MCKSLIKNVEKYSIEVISMQKVNGCRELQINNVTFGIWPVQSLFLTTLDRGFESAKFLKNARNKNKKLLQVLHRCCK